MEHRKTFVKTGCKSLHVDKSWWGTKTGKPFNEMYKLCISVNTNKASSLQTKICCGDDTKTCGPNLLKCQLQRDWVRNGMFPT